MLRKSSKTGIQKAIDMKRMKKEAEEMREAVMKANVYNGMKKNGSK
jgi:hypothetical protein